MHQVQYDNLAQYLAEAKKNIVTSREAIPSMTPTDQFARKQLSFGSAEPVSVPDDTLSTDLPPKPVIKDVKTDAIRLAQSGGG